ncbi:MAG: nucleotidyltransferase domain-containing protein [Candidatus Korarchaeota archaeon]|nr:nucleotidyltransferase domain-containing protein [Candidatus Korarchaeota archaeon]
MPEEGLSLVDLELERLREWRRYLEDPLRYARRMREVARRVDPEARVILYGSRVSGEARPDSDVDVLVVTRVAGDAWARARLRVEIAREIGDYTPFEIHIVTPEEFERWYGRFIGDHIEA